MSSWRVLAGDARERLGELDAESVQSCVTSPPYFGLRDYGHEGQIGLEDTPDAFVEQLVDVFREVRRVLRPDGTLWLNLGDAYANGGSGPPGSRSTLLDGQQGAGGPKRQALGVSRPRPPRLLSSSGIKAKDLVGIPWLAAFALRADGWHLRAEVIWHKPNPMPESVRDRPTKAHETVFLLSKSPRYFYDADAIAEPATGRAPGNTAEAKGAAAYAAGDEHHRTKGGLHLIGASETRNRRSVWTIPTQPYAGAHFATMPPALARDCILAGTPPQSCGVCGAPWARAVKRAKNPDHDAERSRGLAAGAVARTGGAGTGGTAASTLGHAPTPRLATGWASSCDHDDAGTGRALVLDPFAGAGTTGLVALRHGRGFVGVELNPAYAELARDRIRDDSPLHNTHAEVLDDRAEAVG